MKPSELRIGNFINTEKGQAEVKTIALSIINQGVGLGSIYSNELKAEVVHYENCFPIELTEDWLEKFGFFKEDDEWYNGYVRIDSTFDGGFYFSALKDGIVDLSYVHQLQNIAYIINGKDLILEKK